MQGILCSKSLFHVVGKLELEAWNRGTRELVLDWAGGFDIAERSAGVDELHKSLRLTSQELGKTIQWLLEHYA